MEELRKELDGAELFLRNRANCTDNTLTTYDKEIFKDISTLISTVADKIVNGEIAEQKHGKWIVNIKPKIEIIVECSVCHSKDCIPIETKKQVEQWKDYKFTKFCKDCGAKMER